MKRPTPMPAILRGSITVLLGFPRSISILRRSKIRNNETGAKTIRAKMQQKPQHFSGLPASHLWLHVWQGDCHSTTG